MNGDSAVVNYGAVALVTTNDKMKQANKKSRATGITTGLISGLTYGVHTTLVLVAGYYEPLMDAAGVLTAFYVCSGLDDLFADIWLTPYNARCGRLSGFGRSLHTLPGKMIVFGSLLGGPIASGAYLVGLTTAGAYAIPIFATCSSFEAIFAWIFLKQRPTKRVIAGMMTYVVGAIVINWIKPEGSPNFTLGITCALIAAISWGLEGMLSSYGGAIIDTDVAVDLRELISGIIDLVVIVPLVDGMTLLGGTSAAGLPLIWLVLSGLSAAVSSVCWYKSNSTVGCAIGMSLNAIYAFQDVLFCVMSLGQQLTSTTMIGSVAIVFGVILVAMNPLDLLKKGEQENAIIGKNSSAELFVRC